jgi:hypothetical protein
VLVSALVDAVRCLWHPVPDQTVRVAGSDYLAKLGFEGLLCIAPGGMGATHRVALQPRTPALRGAVIVQLMALTGAEYALARRDLDALYAQFTAKRRNRMAIRQPLHLDD